MPQQDDRTQKLQVSCHRCNASFELHVRPKDYERWQAGEYVQACFPYLSPEQRELLIPDLGQGLCGACFDKLGDAEETGR